LFKSKPERKWILFDDNFADLLQRRRALLLKRRYDSPLIKSTRILAIIQPGIIGGKFVSTFGMLISTLFLG